MKKKTAILTLLSLLLVGCQSNVDENSMSIFNKERELYPGDVVYEGEDGYYRFGGWSDKTGDSLILNVENKRFDSGETRNYLVEEGSLLKVKEMNYETVNNSETFNMEIIKKTIKDNSVTIKVHSIE